MGFRRHHIEEKTCLVIQIGPVFFLPGAAIRFLIEPHPSPGKAIVGPCLLTSQRTGPSPRQRRAVYGQLLRHPAFYFS